MGAPGCRRHRRTHARFGLVSPDGTLLHSRTLADEDYPAIDDAIAAFLAERGALPMPRQGAIAIASPITGDRVAMTNHPWSFSILALTARFGFERLEVINDFTALALALPRLTPQDRLIVGGGAAVTGAPIGVLGPGSGLGVSGLVPSGSSWIALTGEGGHATMAARDGSRSAVLTACAGISITYRRTSPVGPRPGQSVQHSGGARRRASAKVSRPPRSPIWRSATPTRYVSRPQPCFAPCSGRWRAIWR